MPDTTQSEPRFSCLSEFLERPEELATVNELCAIGPWKISQIKGWLYESEHNKLEAALVRPTQSHVYFHSGRFKKWLGERTNEVRQKRGIVVSE